MDGYTKPPPGRTIKWGHPHAHGLKLMLPMNELDGVLLNDLSPVRNNATMVGGAQWSGGMVVLDGTDGEITLRRLSGLTDWTVHKRFTPDDVTSISRTLLDQGDILIAQIDDDIIYGATSNLEIDYTSTVSTCLTAGQPVNIFVKRSGTTMTCYVYDAAGKLYTDSFTVSGTAKTSLSNLIIGSQSRTAFVYPALTAANLTAEKALLITAADDVRLPIGSPSLNSDEITECFNATQMTISINIESLNFEPGDGLNHALFDNKGSATNRFYLYISTAGVLFWFIVDKDGDSHHVSHTITDWTIGSRHQIICTLDFNADTMILYTDGVLRDDTLTGALSSDSINVIEQVTHYGSDSFEEKQLNGAATIQIWDVIQDAAWIGEEWAAGLGRKFVVDFNTILMARFSEENTGIVYWHKGKLVSNIVAGGTEATLTTADGAEVFGDGVALIVQGADGFFKPGFADGAGSGNTLVIDDGAGAAVTDIEKVGVGVDFANTYSAVAANNTVHDVGLQDIGFWARIKLSSTPSDNAYIFNKNSKNNGSYAFYITTSGLAILYFKDDGGDAYYITGNTNLADGRVHFIAGIIDRDVAGNCMIIVDGYEDGSTNKAGTLANTVGTLTNAITMIFGTYAGAGFNFTGIVAEAGIAYPGDIMAGGEMGAAGEMLALATNPHDPTAWCNLEDYWLLDENTGTTLNGLNDNLTLSNSAAWSLEAFVTKDHLLTVENGGIGGVGNIDSTWTVSKDTDTKYTNSRSLKGVCAAGDDNAQFTLASPQLVNGEDYWQTIRVWVPDILDDTTLLLDVDGAATPITSIEVGKSLSDDGHFARDFNIAGTYDASGGNIHNIGNLVDFSMSAWVYLDIYLAQTTIITKRGVSNPYWVWGFGAVNGKQSLILRDSAFLQVDSNTSMGLSGWHFLVVTADRNGDAIFYLDGVADGVGDISSQSGDLTNASNPFKIAASWGDRIEGKICDIKIYIGGIWTAGEVLDLYNNPFDLSVVAGKLTDAWFCNDNAANTVVVSQAGGIDLVASANTEDFAEKHWKMYNFCWKADQTDIEVNLRATGAGAASNEVEVNVDAGQLRVNLIENGGFEGVYDDESDGGAGTVNVAPGWDEIGIETEGTDTLDSSSNQGETSHSGSEAQYISVNARTEGIRQRNIPTTAGASYTLSAWVEKISGSGSTIRFAGIPNYKDFEITPSWVKYSVSFIATAGLLDLTIVSREDGNLVFLVDDVSLIKNDTAPSTATRIRNFADGKLDGAVVWDRALSQNDIEAIRRQPYAMIK